MFKKTKSDFICNEFKEKGKRYSFILDNVSV